ncbi:MAG TPA: chemotaxis protein CheV [Hydrogenophaga sp.]|uniref:chemotaxis protein n=1 Tax=Hydrogenophaga sp. TaxID=1904254 RepID=UPI0008C677B3|nr:chemotaxis protein [Hydrogenophaga sp.]OGA77575.1 MAG: chemotaxis protein CheV [Burkholderiales bacterium GWE1_65_30]OGA94003.1 MAG: chemotaxis protein CheV [Burkholderiales bacterium GWF1_66_17]HAX20353.1 chemotaxis protein CheV [Hydrogenophaga sp.]HBU19897.1 chemotaxis protein CheV [Hydrogenophaga sp.]
MTTALHDIEERTNLTGSNKFELMLFRLGDAPGSDRRELFGINVFKVREILVMPTITAIANAPAHVLGVANIRGQIIPVIDLPAVVGCVPRRGLTILMVTEFARTTQAFAVEEVAEIVRLEWGNVLAAEGNGGGLVTSIAKLDGDTEKGRLVQVLDVEQILRNVMPTTQEAITPQSVGAAVNLPEGSIILAADDSPVARMMIEQGLGAMGTPYVMTKTGQEAWDRLQAIEEEAHAEGKSAHDKVALVLTDLEMPVMDGFTLTRNIKQDPRFKSIPVVIHSSLTGTANEAHVSSVGADAYVAKFVASELAATIRQVLKH